MTTFKGLKIWRAGRDQSGGVSQEFNHWRMPSWDGSVESNPLKEEFVRPCCSQTMSWGVCILLGWKAGGLMPTRHPASS